ncbi:MAG TPA: hydrogenase nickel incorporation protein HypB [Lacunisphaera sp.]|jgi:hydrogenase nickel incorporation protein HypB|nr:hydrogenase nickel incorporation protein HypB [Lacunisphaera sp.]
MVQTVIAPPEFAEAPAVDLLADAHARAAARNRDQLGRHGVTALEIIGPIVSGKTALIMQLVERLQASRRIAVVNGDPGAADDAAALAALGVPAIRLGAYGGRLDAPLVSHALARLPLHRLELVLIENVGQLTSPAPGTLGCHARIVVVSVSDGPSMVRQHPGMFRGADLVVVNKGDLAGAMGVNLGALARDIRQLTAGRPVLATSARTGEGLDELAALVNAF